MRGSPGPPGGCPVPFLLMISQKQDRANCANAQKSSSPRTAEGKAASSRNALKSGLYATTLVAHGESKEDFNLLKAQFYRQYQAATPQARLIVDRLIANNWILQRFDHIESEVWEREGTGLRPTRPLRRFGCQKALRGRSHRKLDRDFPFALPALALLT